jgi:hypothetical protein
VSLSTYLFGERNALKHGAQCSEDEGGEKGEGGKMEEDRRVEKRRRKADNTGGLASPLL